MHQQKEILLDEEYLFFWCISSMVRLVQLGHYSATYN